MCQVVHRQQRFFPAVAEGSIDPVVEQHRHQRGLPVVAMHQIRLEVQEFNQPDHRLLKENKALEVVGIAVVRRAVDPRAVEKLLVVDEVGGDTLELLFPDRSIVPYRTQRNVKRLLAAGQSVFLAVDLAVERHHADDFASFPRERLGQSRANIS